MRVYSQEIVLFCGESGESKSAAGVWCNCHQRRNLLAWLLCSFYQHEMYHGWCMHDGLIWWRTTTGGTITAYNIGRTEWGQEKIMSMTHGLEMAIGFHQEHNWPPTFRHANLAATKPFQWYTMPLFQMNRDREDFRMRQGVVLPVANKAYTSTCYPSHFLDSILPVCIINKEYFDAALYARTLWETITLS